MKDRLHSETMAELFHADPAYAAELLAEVHRNGDAVELDIFLRQMITASEGDTRSDDADTGRTPPL